MTEVTLVIELPDYDVKYCEDVFNDIKCKFLQSYDYGLKYYCLLSMKDIIKVTEDGNKVHRPHSCRCLVKK